MQQMSLLLPPFVTYMLQEINTIFDDNNKKYKRDTT